MERLPHLLCMQKYVNFISKIGLSIFPGAGQNTQQLKFKLKIPSL